MIVTIVCDVLGEENNGTTIAAFNLIRSLRARGHTVRVVCPDEMYAGEPDFFIMPTYNFGEFLNNYVHKNGGRTWCTRCCPLRWGLPPPKWRANRAFRSPPGSIAKRRTSRTTSF